MNAFTRSERIVWFAAMALLLAFRGSHLWGPLDEPSWRQVWCAYQAERLASESPMQLLHTKINVRGANDVSFWNFPIYEMVVALAYKLGGGEARLWLARLITLLFFIGGTWFLFRSVCHILGERVGYFTVLVYWTLPLGVFFSRAVHYDIAVLFFCHWYFWEMLRFFEDVKKSRYARAILAMTAAFSMKPPYGFYWALPLVVYAGWGTQVRKWLRVCLLTAGTLVLPVIIAWLLHLHRLSIESVHEASILYPEPYTTGYARNWYFGALVERIDVTRWLSFLKQSALLVSTPLGTLLAILGFLAPPRSTTLKGWITAWALVFGVGLYALLVFPMVSSAHSYYLLPLLVPTAIGVALFLDTLLSAESLYRGQTARLVVIWFALAVSSYRTLREQGYFTYDWHRIRAGEVVARETPQDALIVTTAKGRGTGRTDPRSLYFMRRRGWAIHLDSLGPEELRIFREAGARFVALLVWNDHPTDPSAYPVLSPFPARVWFIKDPAQSDCGALILYDLQGPASEIRFAE